MLVYALAQAFMVGVILAAPIGPVTLLCIRRTWDNGYKFGFFSGLGAATADAFYSAMASFGLDTLCMATADSAHWLTIGGGVIVCALAAKMLFSASRDDDDDDDDDSGSHAVPQCYLSTLLLTLGSPITVATASALLASSLANSALPKSLAVACIFLGSASWYSTLTAIAAHLGTRLGAAAKVRMRSWSALAVLGLGLFSIVHGVLRYSGI